LIEPIFLSLEEIILIHNDQLKRYGGLAGIRDIELLKSAISMPAIGFGKDYVHTDIYEMAAAYLYHIVRNHPFIDGNKRTGVVASIVFLITNGAEVNADEDSFERMVLLVAEGKMNKAATAQFFRNNSGYSRNNEQTE
jgi:death on curing protein